MGEGVRTRLIRRRQSQGIVGLCARAQRRLLEKVGCQRLDEVLLILHARARLIQLRSVLDNSIGYLRTARDWHGVRDQRTAQ